MKCDQCYMSHQEYVVPFAVMFFKQACCTVDKLDDCVILLTHNADIFSFARVEWVFPQRRGSRGRSFRFVLIGSDSCASSHP